MIVVTRPGEVATWLEKDALRAGFEHLGLPVTHLIDDDVEAALAAHVSESGPRRAALVSVEPLEEVARAVVRGRSPWSIELIVVLVVALVVAAIVSAALILYFRLT